MKEKDHSHELIGILILFLTFVFYQNFSSLTLLDIILLIAFMVGAGVVVFFFWNHKFSRRGRDESKRIKLLLGVPRPLLVSDSHGVAMGYDLDLKANVYLPDKIRSRHVHLIGSTGAGKTESVILNFLRQDVKRGYGSIILDAKGDTSFLEELKILVPQKRLKVFDLSSNESLGYNPTEVGSPLEAAQRLFSSLTWSEDYYKSKALVALQKLFQFHFEAHGRNAALSDLANYLETPLSYAAVSKAQNYPLKMAESDYVELSGLRDQINSLCIGHLRSTLSPSGTKVSLDEAASGSVIYFRLQSLLSPQLVAVVGKLVINHLSYLAGTAHRGINKSNAARVFVPVYFDEFASFACPEFADLISKARSAGLALHFSHQSTGDLAEVSKGFLSQITDNSATKIVMRINDPDSAEFFARCFGTKRVQKVTQRITNAKETDTGEAMGEGSQREAHQFRASPDLFKTLPTGVGSVLIAHGEDTEAGASHVFKIRFPALN